LALCVALCLLCDQAHRFRSRPRFERWRGTPEPRVSPRYHPERSCANLGRGHRREGRWSGSRAEKREWACGEAKWKKAVGGAAWSPAHSGGRRFWRNYRYQSDAKRAHVCDGYPDDIEHMADQGAFLVLESLNTMY
jgi:hypothetical protein